MSPTTVLDYFGINPMPFEAMGRGVAKWAPQRFYIALAPTPYLLRQRDKESWHEPFGAFRLISHFASVASILGNTKLLSFIKSFCFGCSYFWQCEVSELLSNHYALFVHIFGNAESWSFYIKSLCFDCMYFWQWEVTELFIISMCFGCSYFWQHEATQLFHIIVLLLHVFWQLEVNEPFIISMCFGSTYFWQCEVTELFYITMYIEIEML